MYFHIKRNTKFVSSVAFIQEWFKNLAVINLQKERWLREFNYLNSLTFSKQSVIFLEKHFLCPQTIFVNIISAICNHSYI